MALVDVKDYFLKVQDQYNTSCQFMEAFAKEYKQGNFTDEQMQENLKDFNVVKTNYERLAYVMYLLEKPRNTKKSNVAYNQHKKKEHLFGGCSDKIVIDENTSVINNLKDIGKDIEV